MTQEFTVDLLTVLDGDAPAWVRTKLETYLASATPSGVRIEVQEAPGKQLTPIQIGKALELGARIVGEARHENPIAGTRREAPESSESLPGVSRSIVEGA